MSASVYRLSDLLAQMLADVPVETNLGLLHLQVALLSGRFLAARGAIFPALDALGLEKGATHRAHAALCYGRWNTDNLLQRWQQTIIKEGHFKPSAYEGIQPVACDLTAFFHPQLRGLTSKHYVSEAGKALPALVFGLCVNVGRVCGKRLGIPRLLLRREVGETEAALQKRLMDEAAKTLAPQVLATNWTVSAEALWRLYRDRWAVEQLPLAAKPMLGCERSFVSGKESRFRLPELALLAGNLLSYVAATTAPVATGFWDRAANATGGRLRRALSKAPCSKFACAGEQLRKKNSVTAHRVTGAAGRRQTKAAQTSLEMAQVT